MKIMKMKSKNIYIHYENNTNKAIMLHIDYKKCKQSNNAALAILVICYLFYIYSK